MGPHRAKNRPSRRLPSSPLHYFNTPQSTSGQSGHSREQFTQLIALLKTHQKSKNKTLGTRSLWGLKVWWDGVSLCGGLKSEAIRWGYPFMYTTVPADSMNRDLMSPPRSLVYPDPVRCEWDVSLPGGRGQLDAERRAAGHLVYKDAFKRVSAEACDFISYLRLREKW
ncbi:unnamed protein product [Arctogadus glacialis]